MNPELENLIQRFIDGTATAAEAAGLSHQIETSETARLAYLTLAEIHAALAADETLRAPAAVSRPKPELRPLPPSRRRPVVKTRRPSITPWLAAAAALLLAAIIFYPSLSRPTSTALANAAPPGVAVLAGVAGAVWSEPSPAPDGTLTPGRLKLESGMAAIEFNSGARLLLEGPAEVDLVSTMEANFRSGKLRANVPPPAHGFSINTPSTRVVDLGTTFGLAVHPDGSTRIKVMDGKVELRHGSSVHPLETDAAASVDAAGNPAAVRIPDEAFPSEENFMERIATGARHSTTRWQAATAALAKDPATLISFNFQESTPSSRSVRNQAANAPVESHGTLVGTGWTEGRWPGKHALEFNGRSDRMLFKLSGSSPAATYLAWLRVDSLPNLYNILLMPDTSKKSALQWMLQKSGEMRLTLTNDLAAPTTSKGWEPPVKAAAISNPDLGRWVFLASTYDSTTGDVTHFRDGRIIGTGTFPLGLPVVFDSYSFGNWAETTAGESAAPDRFRNLVGSLDEFAILSRAMSPDEIEQFYQSGKP
jgi:ferric-dicitrate binding protein FerR (iron transport regulator)